MDLQLLLPHFYHVSHGSVDVGKNGFKSQTQSCTNLFNTKFQKMVFKILTNMCLKIVLKVRKSVLKILGFGLGC